MCTNGKVKLFFPYYSWKIPKETHERYECIAFHMTDLPFGRGGSPLQNLILRGFTETVITAFRVTDEWDAGPIYLKRPLSLDGTAQEIFDRASKIIYNDMIPFILMNDIIPTPQEGEVVLFHRIKRSEFPEPARMWQAWGYK
jgi:methionyl-tRNA formyltransferase